jgi:hypothetical protein
MYKNKNKKKYLEDFRFLAPTYIHVLLFYFSHRLSIHVSMFTFLSPVARAQSYQRD